MDPRIIAPLLTAALLICALVGYYVLFYLGVLLKARQLAAAGRRTQSM